MIDSHAHLDAPELAGDVDNVVDRFRSAGGTVIVNCASNVSSCHNAVSLSQKFSEVYPTVGLHPELAVPGTDIYYEGISKKWISEQVAAISELLSKYPKIVGIGECGLDYSFMKRERMLGREKMFADQKELFASCITLATEHDLPLVVHCRDEDGDKQAEAEALELLVKIGGSHVKGVFHSYTGSLDYLEDILGLGFYVSFNGIVTYKNAENVRLLLDRVPMDRLLIETDAPWLVPNRRRSAGISVCEPAFVDEVAEAVAKRKGCMEERVWKDVEENFERLFAISRKRKDMS